MNDEGSADTVAHNNNKATRLPEISRQQVQKLTPQFVFYIYIGYGFPLSLSTTCIVFSKQKTI